MKEIASEIKMVFVRTIILQLIFDEFFKFDLHSDNWLFVSLTNIV